MEPAVGSMYTLTTLSGQLVSPLGIPFNTVLPKSDTGTQQKSNTASVSM